MRKNINKLIAVAIGVSVMSGSVIPAFAADTAQNTTTISNVQTQGSNKTLLTLDDAIAAGIANDNQLLIMTKNINLQEDLLDLADEQGKSGYDYDSQELKVKQLKQQRDFAEDKVAQNITDLYNNLISQGKALNKLKKQVEIKTKQVSDAQLKKNLGLITSIDLTQTQIEIQSLQNNVKNAENTLKNSQDYFQVVLNKDLSKYTLVQDTNYEEFKITGSVDDYLDSKIDDFLEYDKESYDLLKDHVKNDVGTVQDPGKMPELSDFQDTTNSDGTVVTKQTKYQKALDQYKDDLGKYTSYLTQKFTVASTSASLSEEKRTLKNGLNTCYTTLLKLGDNINVLKAQMDLTNKQLSNMKLKYDLGLVTKTDYDTQVLASDDQEINLRALIDNYNKLKNNIQKPWTISASGGAAAAQ